MRSSQVIAGCPVGRRRKRGSLIQRRYEKLKLQSVRRRLNAAQAPVNWRRLRRLSTDRVI
ncbi:uncharacterized protein METZ01_LOCUS445103 [marine metagenome]|uniref:Uncharacterized protein n=1 Tax=marine metagenome TaxID=408172 RepID=A0A382ZAL9_9ZZZZ